MNLVWAPRQQMEPMQIDELEQEGLDAPSSSQPPTSQLSGSTVNSQNVRLCREIPATFVATFDIQLQCILLSYSVLALSLCVCRVMAEGQQLSMSCLAESSSV